MKRPAWQIYYGDGSTYSSLDGAPEDAPGGNVQVIAFYDADNRRKLAHDKRWYYYEAGYWFAADDLDFTQYALRPGKKIFKLGQTVNDLQFRSVMLRATTELPLEGAS